MKTQVKVKTKITPITLGYLIFKIRSKYSNVKDHSLIAQYITNYYKINITKEDIDNYYGFNDIVVECFEDESRIQEYKLKLT